jgi:hypothetical protein
MVRPFKFSPMVTACIVLLVIAACVVAIWAPNVSLAFGMLGALCVAAIWFKVAIRTRKWAWWEFGVESLTQTEGLIGVSGTVLFASAFVALIAGMRNAT